MNTRTRNILLGVLALILVLVVGGWLVWNYVLPPERRIDPSVVSATPADGYISRDDQIVIRFDQRMDHEQVEAAFSISPAVEGVFSWESVDGGERLIFTPRAPLPLSQQYTVTIGATATNVAGRALGAPHSFSVQTGEAVGIAEVQPAPGSDAVATGAPITVRFEEPIVELVSLDEQQDFPQPVTVEPAIEGLGRWLGPDLFGFYPEQPLAPATTYRVTVAPDLTVQSVLEEPFEWSFTTEGVAVSAAIPFDGATKVDIDSDVTITFNRPVNRPAVEENFRLVAAETGNAVAGELRWGDDRKLIFAPAAPLDVASTYSIAIEADDAGLQASFEATFVTVEHLQVESVQPAPDAVDVSISPTDTLISVQFNHPVVPLVGQAQQADLPVPIQIEPTLDGEGEWLTTSLFTFRPREPLLPSTEYVVTVPAGLTDTLGTALQEAYVWRFTTVYPQAIAVTPTGPENLIGATGPFTVTFNQAMDPESTAERFRVTVGAPDGPEIAGTVEWPDPAHLVFTPDEEMPRDETAFITVDAGAEGARGGETRESAQFTRRVAPHFAVVSTDPVDGAQNVNSFSNVQITFNVPIRRQEPGQYVPTDDLKDFISIEPEPDDIFTNIDAEGYRLFIWVAGGMDPSSSYTVTVEPDLTSLFGEALAQPYTFRFQTKPLPPLLEFRGVDPRIGTYGTVTRTLQIVAHRNLDAISLSLYRMEQNEFLRLAAPDAWEAFRAYQGNDDNLVTSWQIDTSETALNVLDLRKTLVPSGSGELDPGLYFLKAEGSGTTEEVVEPAKTLMVVSPYNLTLKRSPRDVLVWATDLRTAESLSDLYVQVVESDGTVLAEGRTDEQGLFTAPIERREDPWRPVFALASEEPAGPPIGLTSDEWSTGAQIWEFGFPVDLSPPDERATIYTDRPLYRPGQTVYFKGVIRQDADGAYSLLPGRTVDVVINDAEGKEILTRELPLTPYGTFYGDITVPEETPIGPYSIRVDRPEPTRGFSGTFFVAEYRRPEFQVAVEPSRSEVVQSESLTTSVTAEYFFGGALSGADVAWRVLRRPYYFDPGLPGYWSWHDFDDERVFFDFQRGFGQDLVADGTGTLDTRGRFTFEIPTDLSEYKQSQTFIAEADVTDVNDQVVSGRGEVVVHRGAFYVGIRANTFVGEAGEPLSFDLRTLTPSEEAYANAELQLEFAQREWYSVREEREDGGFYWTTKFTDTVESTAVVTTDAEGKASVEFTPEQGGTYTLLARGTDEAGNEVRSRAFVWVTSGRFVSWRQENDRKLELVADQQAYEPGDTANLLVPTPFEGMRALVTVERGNIKTARVIELPTNSETIQVPIEGAYAPNVFVSVVAVKGFGPDTTLPDIRMGYLNLDVAPEQQTLDIEVTPSTEELKPRETVTFTVEVRRRSDGAPVQAELSAALVDKALLSLMEDPNPTLTQAFYGERALSVRTGGTLFNNVDLVSEALSPEAKGGGGGGGEFGPPLVREDFPETAYWDAALVTDEAGRVSFTVTLPDNLTTWTLRVRGVTEGTQVGETSFELVSTLPFFVRPAVPRFFVVDDEPVLQAIVHNNTGEDLNADVALNATGLEVLDDAVQTVEVPAGGRTVVTYRARVEQSEEAQLQFRASASGYEDAVQLALPVHHLVAPEVVATSGQVRGAEGSAVEQILLPPDADPTQGDLTVETAPSLAGMMETSLEYLETFPYYCTEQVVSSFLPNIMTFRALQEAGVERGDLEEPLRGFITTAIQRLTFAQNTDGGWGWWSGDESQPWLTAYATLGLHVASDAGFAVPDDTLDDAAQYLNRWLRRTGDRDDTPTLDTRAFVLFVLSEVGEPDVGRTVRLYEQRTLLDTDGVALLALTLDTIGGEQAERAQTLVSDLTGQAILSATGAHWEEATPDPYAMDSSLRSTALVLSAFSRIDVDQLLVPQTVRWLMMARQAGKPGGVFAWETTQETAWAVMGLTEYMVASRELQGSFAYDVVLNGERLVSKQVSRENVTEVERLTVEVQNLLLDEANELVFNRRPGDGTGEGRLYYAAWLRYSRSALGGSVPAQDEGLSVSRRYEGVDPVTLQPTGAEVDPQGLKIGDVVQVRLTVQAPNDLYYFTLEDPLPAGFEALDPTLLTTSEAAEGPIGERVDGDRGPFWFDGWTRREIRDEKVVLFSTELPRGTYEYTYLARVTSAGDYTALPAIGYQMYMPEVYGRSTSLAVKITR